MRVWTHFCSFTCLLIFHFRLGMAGLFIAMINLLNLLVCNFPTPPELFGLYNFLYLGIQILEFFRKLYAIFTFRY